MSKTQQSLPQYARAVFKRALEERQAQALKTRPRKGTIEHYDVFLTNEEAAVRRAAFDAVAEAVGRALKTQDIMKVHAVMRRASIHYIPKKVIKHEDGTMHVRPATAEMA